MLTAPFLTELDSRAAVKGSRDPLGIQAIWTRLGRHVVGNLTTVSDSVRDYTTLLLGYHFAEQLSDELEPGSELRTFLKWEQLVGYARALVNEDFRFRGTGRVQRNLARKDRISLSDHPADQILGNQKIYGLWGLFTSPARASRLLDDETPPRLTAAARHFVEEVYLKRLEDETGKGCRGILDLLRAPHSTLDPKGRHKRLVEAVGGILRPKLTSKERAFFRQYLLLGGPADSTAGRQAQLAELLKDTLQGEQFAWSPPVVGDLVKAARPRGAEWEELAIRLERIRLCECVMAPISALFGHLLGMEDGGPSELARRVKTAWGEGLRSIDAPAFRELQTEIADGVPEVGDRWVAIAEAAADGRYVELSELLLAQNAWVMSARGGSAWVGLRNGRFHIRYKDDTEDLPQRSQLPWLWRFSYFLGPLRNVAHTLEVA